MSSSKQLAHKLCKLCKQDKQASAYQAVKQTIGGLHTYCRPCRNIVNGAWKKSKRLTDEPWRQRIIAADRARGRALRLETVSAYGGRCECCGETHFEFLGIDHINNDGSAHKRSIGGASALCRWLKKNGFPRAGFRLLCHNCNLARGFYGRCPHETEREAVA